MFEDVFKRFLRKIKIPHKFIESRSEVHFNCPFCDDQRSRLYVNLKTQKGYCHNEQLPISPSQLFRYFNYSPSAIRSHYAAGLHSLRESMERLVDTNGGGKKVEVSPRIRFLSSFIPIERGSRAFSYLFNREIGTKKIKRYGLMDCVSGRFYGRIILPIKDHDGRVISYAGRDYLGQSERKYLFAEGTKVGTTLYRAEYLKPLRRVILVEGQFPALLFGKDFYCTFGKKLSRGQILQLFKTNPSEVIVLFDADADALEQADAVGARLVEWFPTKVVHLPYGQPDDFSKEVLFDLIRNTPYLNTTFEWQTQLRYRGV